MSEGAGRRVRPPGRQGASPGAGGGPRSAAQRRAAQPARLLPQAPRGGGGGWSSGGGGSGARTRWLARALAPGAPGGSRWRQRQRRGHVQGVGAPGAPVRQEAARGGGAEGKPDLNTALPVRQTASIFKQPVTKITNHPSNKVKSDPQKAVDQPRQLFWEKKLSGLNAFDIAEELVKTMDLPKGLQGVGPGCTDETLLSAIASALHTSTMPITGQLSAAVEKNPGVWLNTSQPLCKAFMVTDEDIRKQEELVQQVRKRLEEALMADMLAHVEEIARDGDAPGEKGAAEEEEEDDEEEEEQDQDHEMENV
uniref:Methyl-CpG binding domain protein 3 n=1 Tax=Monodelphis domestica TaxID=13616 RepID=F6UWH4_MONDO